MTDNPAPQPPSGGRRRETALQLAPVFCWLGVLIGLLGANLITLVVGVLYAVAAVGFHKRQRWAATLAIVLSSIFLLLDIFGLIVVLTAGHLVVGQLQPVGSLMRMGFDILILLLASLSRPLLQPRELDKVPERGGAV